MSPRKGDDAPEDYRVSAARRLLAESKAAEFGTGESCAHWWGVLEVGLESLLSFLDERHNGA